MERWVEQPTNIYEFLFYSPWPIAWAYTLLGAVLLCGVGLSLNSGGVSHLAISAAGGLVCVAKACCE